MKNRSDAAHPAIPTPRSSPKSGPAICLWLWAPLLCCAVSCRGVDWKQGLIYSRFPVSIYLEREEKEGKTVPQGFVHPSSIPPENLKSFLASLKFKSWGLFKGTGEDPLLSEPEIDKLVEPLSSALSKAGPDERVRFLVARTAWKIAAKGTSGVVFLDSPEHLNLALDFIDETLTDEKGDPEAMVFRDDPVKITGKNPEIIPPPGAWIRPAEGGKVHPRWVVVDPAKLPLAIPVPPPVSPDAAAPKATGPSTGPSGADEVKRRLENLENLKKEGVISPEEYEAARKEILLQKDR